MSVSQARYWSLADVLPAPSAASRVHPESDSKTARDSGAPPHPRAIWWATLLRHDLEALQERRDNFGQVLMLTWGGTLFIAIYAVVVFGWGTGWRMYPVNFLQLFVGPLARVLLNFVAFSMPWQRVQTERPLLLAGLGAVQLLSALIPTVWALAGTEDLPLEFLGSRAYFTASFIPGLIGGGFSVIFSNPAMEAFWPAPLSTIIIFVVFHAVRIADPLADAALISIGLRHATAGECPFRGGQWCNAHFSVLSLMTVMLVFDWIAASAVAGMLYWLKLGREAEGRWSTRLECLSVASEAGFTALGVAFVVCGMTSKTGVDTIFVVVCAANTAGLVLWMALALWSRTRRLQTQTVNIAPEGTLAGLTAS